jgi:MFS family permease
LGLASLLDSATAFTIIAMTISCLTGFAIACNIVGEQALLLKYSNKEDREKNLGYFRAASGVGALLAPLLGAGLYALWEYCGLFMFIGIGYLVICPVIYFKLYQAKEAFQKAIDAQNRD